MKFNYDKIVRLICGDNWETDQVSLDERDGGYGVAICLACLQGWNGKFNELGDIIGCPVNLLEVAYKRLQINGVFAYDSPILNDKDLKMSRAVSDEDMDRCLKAWCHIAGLASGFVGKGSPRSSQSLYSNRIGK